ncbi:MAG: mechanosensitive ion channel family protein [Fibrobacterota bacterium]
MEPDFFAHLKTILQTELYRQGDAAVTVGQLGIALAVLGAGSIVSRWLSGFVGRRLNRLGSIHGGTLHSVRQIVFYLLFIVTVMGAFSIAGIPLTIFTVLGGAFAIGIGFGAQNTINNLLSGIILLFEKPVRINDIVEIHDMAGRVAEIGHRVVRVRRVDGVDILIPASHFLDKLVVNWTLHDAAVRGSIDVGIAYGSDTQKADGLLRKVLGENQTILKMPAPEVIFADFGDSSLLFSCFFWVQVRTPMDRRRIESQIRFAVDDHFRDAGIIIAFPQRDLHLSLAEPVPVRNFP